MSPQEVANDERFWATYNQPHVPRSYTQGKRRFSVYWAWSYPWEANRDTTELDNRFSTMTEVRRVGWPKFESDHWHRPYRNVSAPSFVACVARLAQMTRKLSISI